MFSALLEKYNRSHQVLNSLSGTLRDLGAFSKAREYSLEAYEAATEEADKQSYAQSLALLADDYDKKIEWLGKADQTNPYVKGDLLTSKGRKAAEDNTNEKALSYYQQAIDVYKKIPASASQHNNIALIYLAKYRIENESSDFDAALENLDQAIALVPEDSIVLGNAATQYFQKAYIDLQNPYIDFKALEFSASLDLFSYLYNDQAGKAEFRAKLGRHPAFKKGLAYLEKQVLLAPKSVDALDTLASVYSFMDDAESTSTLVSRLQNVELDLASQTKQLLDYRNGVDRQESLENNLDFIKRTQQRAKASGNIKNAKNQLILSSYALSTKRGLIDFGKAQASEPLIALARSNYAKDGSSGARSDLESALKYHMLDKARRNLDGYSEFLEKYQLAFGQSALLCLSLSSNKDFKEMVMKDEFAGDLQTVIIAGLKNFPKSANLYDWKILSEFGNEKASMVRDAYMSNKRLAASQYLNYKSSSNKEYKNYHKTLKQEMLGNSDEAVRLNKEAVESGLLIPSLY